MRQKSGPEKQPAAAIVKDIRRATRRQFSAEEKIRIVLEGLRGEESIAELCRREGIASSMISSLWPAICFCSVRRQHSWDRLGLFAKGGFLVHRSHQERR